MKNIVRDGRLMVGLMALVAAVWIAVTSPVHGALLDASDANLLLWVRADSSVELSGLNAVAWGDLSSNSNNLTQGTVANQPVFTNIVTPAGIRPALQATSGAQVLTAGSAFAGNVFTVYAVARSTNWASGANLYYTRIGSSQGFGMDFQSGVTRLRGFNASSQTSVNNGTPVNGDIGIFGAIIDGTYMKARWINPAGTLSTASNSFTISASTQPFATGATGGSGGGHWRGEMFEFIVLNKAVNTAERILLENGLMSKYATNALAGDDRYTGDTALKGDYDYGVFGIGRVDAGNQVTNNIQDGLTIEATNALADGAWVLAGHRSDEEGRSASDLPSGMTQRWARVWYVEKTGSAEVRLTFTYGKIGLAAPAPGASFELLYSSQRAPYAFTKLGLTATVNGDEVSFNVPNGSLANGYYTLASTEALPAAPAAVTVAALPGGMPSTNALTNLVIWLRADMLAGRNVNNQPNPLPALGASVSNWWDLSAYQNNEGQATVANQPIFTNTTVEAGARYSLRYGGGANVKMTAGAAFTGNVFTLYAVARSTNYNDNYPSLLNTRAGDDKGGFGVDSGAGNYNLRGFNATGQTAPLIYTLANNTTYVFGGIIDGVSIRQRLIDSGGLIQVNQTTFTIGASTQPFVAGGKSGGAGGRNWNGDIFEMLVFNRVLNGAEQVVVENYLVAMYATNRLTTGDHYVGKLAANGDYDYDVFGIGRANATTAIKAAGSAGLGLAERGTGALLDNQEWVFAGHNGLAATLVSWEGTTGQEAKRWGRVWYLDINTAYVDLRFTFDGAAAGLTVPETGRYWLLYRATQAGAWTTLSWTPTFSENRVIFDVPANLLQSGYYTLGSLPSGTVFSIR